MRDNAFIGPYRLTELVARDGMKCSYRVETPSAPGPPRILKTLAIPTQLEAETRERFRREVVIQMSLHHPNIWEVVDSGFWADGIPYVVMDDLGGKTLAQELRDGGVFGLSRWAEVMEQLLMGLEALHKAGIVHRDLSPDGVIVTAEGTCKIVDFAFSSRIAGARLTATGVSIGRPEYMAPEQIFNAHYADARSDLFSLGVSGYELLSGHLPIEVRSTPERLSRMASGEYDPLERYRPELPGPLAKWLSGLMEVNRDKRPDNATAARTALLQATTASNGT